MRLNKTAVTWSVIAAFALSAVGVGVANAIDGETIVDEVAPPAALFVPQYDVFERRVRSLPSFQYDLSTSADYRDLANIACDALAARPGISYYDLAITVGLSLPSYEAGQVFRFATKYVCPENTR